MCDQILMSDPTVSILHRFLQRQPVQNDRPHPPVVPDAAAAAAFTDVTRVTRGNIIDAAAVIVLAVVGDFGRGGYKSGHFSGLVVFIAVTHFDLSFVFAHLKKKSVLMYTTTQRKLFNLNSYKVCSFLDHLLYGQFIEASDSVVKEGVAALILHLKGVRAKVIDEFGHHLKRNGCKDPSLSRTNRPSHSEVQSPDDQVGRRLSRLVRHLGVRPVRQQLRDELACLVHPVYVVAVDGGV